LRNELQSGEIAEIDYLKQIIANWLNFEPAKFDPAKFDPL